MQDEFKTKIITYDERKIEVKDTPVENNQGIQNVLFNVTTKVPHPVETLPTTKVEIPKTTKKIDLRSAEKVNKNASSMPSFYKKELHRAKRLVIIWSVLLILCIALATWAIIAIVQSGQSGWLSLLLVPGLGLAIAMLVIYSNNYINFRNEARHIDFSKEKVISTNVMKLYKRLKTAHINVNWFCGLTYAAGAIVLLGTYLVNWALWGFKDFGKLNDPSFVIMICTSIAMIAAFILHIVLLVTNYVRAGKIDSFYSIQIVSDEELEALKKKKNKRDLIIFMVIVLILIFIAFLIYKLVQRKKSETNITVNNGPSATIGK